MKNIHIVGIVFAAGLMLGAAVPAHAKGTELTYQDYLNMHTKVQKHIHLRNKLKASVKGARLFDQDYAGFNTAFETMRLYDRDCIAGVKQFNETECQVIHDAVTLTDIKQQIYANFMLDAQDHAKAAEMTIEDARAAGKPTTDMYYASRITMRTQDECTLYTMHEHTPEGNSDQTVCLKDTGEVTYPNENN